jgi:hypothetical protein
MIIPGSDSTWLYYVDESHDDEKFALIGMGLRINKWLEAFQAVKAFRSELRDQFGVRSNVEIHARDLVAGRGTLGRDKRGNRLEFSRRMRADIYSSLLRLVSTLPSVHIINVCLDVEGRKDPELDAWDRLFNRMERTAQERNRREARMRDGLLARIKPHLDDKDFERTSVRLAPYGAHVILIADEGRERDIARMRRKMAVHNPVPSQFKDWGAGKATKNIPLMQFVEDAVFQDSARSHFIQLADCVAYALLKRETTPTPNVKKHGLHKLWDLHLRDVRFWRAAPRDDDGIVRK